MKEKKQTTIASKMALAIIILIATGMSLLGIFITSYQTQTMLRQMEEFGTTVVQQLAETSMESVLSEDILGLKVVVTNLVQNDTVIGAAIYSDNGTTLANAGHIPDQNLRDVYSSAKQLKQGFYQIDWLHTKNKDSINLSTTNSAVSFITPIRYRKITTGHALVSFDYHNLHQATHLAIKIIALTTLLLILITALIAFAISRRMAKPIHQLMIATKEMGEGNYHYQITERRNDEIGVLMSAFNHMSQGLLEKTQVEHVFSQFVSPGVASNMLKNISNVELGGKKVTATVVFADIVGFTNMTENLPPEEVADLLNECFYYVDKASYYYRGTIDKFMGDCAMVVFGVPNEDIEHRFHAVECSIMILRLAVMISDRRRVQGKPPIYFRIGINSGEMLAGNLGSVDRMQYTVVGDTVNLASRLASVANRSEIIIAESLFTHPDIVGRITAKQKGSIHLRGINEPVNTYLIQDVAATYRSIMENNIQKIISNELQSTNKTSIGDNEKTLERNSENKS